MFAENQQLRKEFAWSLESSTPSYRVEKDVTTGAVETANGAVHRAPILLTDARFDRTSRLSHFCKQIVRLIV